MTGITDLQEALAPQGFEVVERDGERSGIERFAIRDDVVIAEGGFFTGSAHIKRWIELNPETVFSPDDERDRALFNALTGPLEAGSYVMVHYVALDTTKEALNVDVPPATTPLGYLLWDAGFRWYKDWYIAEGAREGGQKLQANLPVDEETRQERETAIRDEVRSYLDGSPERDRCRELAERLLDRA